MVKITLRGFLIGIIVITIGLGLFIYKAKFGINFYERTPPVLPAGLNENSVLVFSKTNGFPHISAIKAAKKAFNQMAIDNDWSIYITNNGAIFNPDQLQNFDVVIWNNVSGKVLTREQRASFRSYIEGGGGYVGIHAAGDGSHHWDWYEDKVINAHFSHHTMNPQFQPATMQLENNNTELATGLMPRWERDEEWYMFYDNPRVRGSTILYTVDESRMNPSGNIPILASNKNWGMGTDHPIVWLHKLEKGRVFYSALGHSGKAFEEENHLRLLENAIKWAGDF